MQLVSVAERSAGLVKCGTSPHSTRQDLVQEPSVDQEVERRIRRLDLDRAERLVPESLRPRERLVDARGLAPLRGQLARLGAVFGVAEDERERDGLVRREHHFERQRRARIERGAGRSRRGAGDTGGARARGETREELGPVARHRRDRAGRAEEAAALGERRRGVLGEGCRELRVP